MCWSEFVPGTLRDLENLEWQCVSLTLAPAKLPDGSASTAARRDDSWSSRVEEDPRAVEDVHDKLVPWTNQVRASLFEGRRGRVDSRPGSKRTRSRHSWTWTPLNGYVTYSRVKGRNSVISDGLHRVNNRMYSKIGTKECFRSFKNIVRWICARRISLSLFRNEYVCLSRKYDLELDIWSGVRSRWCSITRSFACKFWSKFHWHRSREGGIHCRVYVRPWGKVRVRRTELVPPWPPAEWHLSRDVVY